MDIHEIQELVREYDSRFWSHAPGIDTTVHSTLHLGKLIGKISAYCEVADHGEIPDDKLLIEEVIPDLLFFAARIANNEDLDLEEVFQNRVQSLEVRFRGDNS
jgi:hypothetical protein